jgi:hypothetical protein
MRLRTALSFATLVGFLSILTIGCGQETDVKLAKPTGEVKPSAPIPPAELKGAAKKAVGPGTSANLGKMGKNPMELAR